MGMLLFNISKEELISKHNTYIDALISVIMEETRPEGLEGNLAKNSSMSATNPSTISAQEEIGFHKGALNTLMAERNELVKMVGNVDTIMRAHIERLKTLGVDIGTQQ